MSQFDIAPLMDDLRLLLWTTGHYRNPKYPDTHNVTKDEALRLQPTDKVFILATQSYQRYLKPTLDQLTLAFHQRASIADGKTGPATAVLAKWPRCKHPDFEVSEEDDLEVARLWSKQEANWPTACRREIVTGRDFGALPGMTQADTDGIWWASCNNWTAAFADIEMTPGPVGNPSGTHFYARVERMSGSILAYSYLAQNTCNVRLDQAYNSIVSWGKALASTTKTHEDGHALGWNHLSDGLATMYPSIHSASQARYGYPHSSDMQAGQALGYTPHSDWASRQPSIDKLFSPRDTTPVPPVPPDDSGVNITGRLTINDKPYILVREYPYDL